MEKNLKPLQLFRPVYQVNEILEELRPVLEKGWSGRGEKSLEFEQKFKELYLRGLNYPLYVNSATSALHIAIKLLDLEKDDGVISTPLTFVSTNAVISYEKLWPIFGDVNKEDLSLSADDVLRKIERTKAKAVLWVHYGGNVSNDFYKFMENKPSHVHCIEDCAHAMGAFYRDGTPVGSRTDTISCFSFHSVKNLSAVDGGMLVVPRAEQYERANRLSWLGINKNTFNRMSSFKKIYDWEYTIDELGFKYNSNDVLATIALVQFKYFMHENKFRNDIANWYKAYLSDKVTLLKHNTGSSHHLVVIVSNKRDEIMTALNNEKIATGVHYLPNYRFPVFEFDYDGSCGNAQDMSSKIISLPNHLELTQLDVKRICEVINGVA